MNTIKSIPGTVLQDSISRIPEPKQVDIDARRIADLVIAGHQAAGDAVYRELCSNLKLWEGLVLQDKVATILNRELPGWRACRPSL